MIRSTGYKRTIRPEPVPEFQEPGTDGNLIRMMNQASNFTKAFDLESAGVTGGGGGVGGVSIGNAERPSNLWYKVTGQSTYWYMYALMDWYKSEVSVLSTIINRSTQELFRYGLELKPKFAYKCVECGHESDYILRECPVCGSKHLRKPDPSQKEYFVRPNGKSFLDEANDNGQTLKDVLKAYAEMQYQNNQAYTLCVTGDILDGEGELLRAYPLEFISVDPKFVKFLYDDTGKLGTTYAFTRQDRNSLINFENPSAEDRSLLEYAEHEGYRLFPACWQIGSNYGGTGRYWIYSKEEVYQDHWFAQSMIYGVPIWFDIEDDLLSYHYLEKHFLKRYKFGYVRKMVILPGFNDDDLGDIVQGIQDVMAKNDNSIPIICLPPQLPGTAEMRAQTLELGTENANDAIEVKNEIRDRLCAHIGVPNMFAGDVEASGGMNNESQQITIYDRYLMAQYERIDRQCDWIMSWFPRITDWELRVMRPSKAYTDAKRRLDRIQEASQMKQLGFPVELTTDGEFIYGQRPYDQVQQEQQMEQQEQAQNAQMGLMPGDGEGPPEAGTMRRADAEVAGSKDEVDLSKRESAEAADV